MEAVTFDLYQPTDRRWLEVVINDFDSFLMDHAACEKKASAMAMTMISHYPDKVLLVEKMLPLAIEELNHYKQVVEIIYRKGLTLQADKKDDYVNALHQLMDRGAGYYLRDRLIIASIIERRGQERFALLARHLNDDKLKQFYRMIAASEAKHYQLFIALAQHYYDSDIVRNRLHQLLEKEAVIIESLTRKAALH